MADIRKTVEIVFQGRDNASAAVQSINESLSGIDNNAKSATGGLQSVNAELDKLGDKNVAIDRVNDALKAFAVGVVVKEFVEANIAAEKFQAAMTIVTGTTQGAAEAFEYVRDVSDRLGIGVNQTAAIFSKFAAAVKGTAIEGQDSLLIFESFSRAILATGGNTNDVAGAFTQLTQGISKGRFELEDLKSIAERIPGFFSQFAESLGVTTAELFKLISAGEIGSTEILAFARNLNQAFSDVRIDTFEAELARLQNTINDLYLDLGRAGVFDALTKGLTLATATAIGAVAAFKLVGETLANLAISLQEQNFSFGGAIFSQGFSDRFSESFNKAADSVRTVRDRLFEVQEESKKSFANAAANTEPFTKATGGANDGVKQLDASLKALGINPEQFREPVEKVVEAFAKLSTSAEASSAAIITGLLASLTKVSDPQIIDALGQYAISALEARKDTEGLAAVTNALGQAKLGAIPKIDQYTKEIKKAQDEQKRLAKETKDAADKAQQFRIEMEKLASNERIKALEFSVKLDIAKVEADLAKFKTTIESVTKGLESTGQVINAAFGALSGAGGFYGLEKLKIIEEQLKKENEFRKEQFDLQKSLVEEQIKRLRAQTEALTRGDAIIKIDGTGLAPQLEAFMFEILRAIQVRVNNDGLPLLLGT
jgi:tape measure domain-containing protein